VTQNVRVPSRNAKSTSRIRRISKEMQADVFDLRLAAGKVYAATDHGLWAGSATEKVLRSLAEKSIAGPVHSVEVAADGRELWVVISAGILHSSDGGVTWSPLSSAAPASPQWIRLFLLTNPGALLVGTANGVYTSRNSGQSWELLQSGLPAAPPNPPFFLREAVVISLKSGRLYLSGDSAESWARLDGVAEEGVFTGLAPDGQGGFFAGSRTEGVLHWGQSISK